MRIKVALLLVQTFALAAFVMPLNDAHQKGALRFANSVHAAYLLLSSIELLRRQSKCMGNPLLRFQPAKHLIAVDGGNGNQHDGVYGYADDGYYA